MCSALGKSVPRKLVAKVASGWRPHVPLQRGLKLCKDADLTESDSDGEVPMGSADSDTESLDHCESEDDADMGPAADGRFEGPYHQQAFRLVSQSRASEIWLWAYSGWTRVGHCLPASCANVILV